MPTNPHVNEVLVISEAPETPTKQATAQWMPLIAFGAAVAGLVMWSNKKSASFSGVKDDDTFTCAKCSKETEEYWQYMDSYYEDTVCEFCWNERFAKARRERNAEWFELNYNKSDYPAKFWKKVGAFQKRVK